MDEQRSPVERVADVVVYAPLGLALEAGRVVPEMAERGRRQVTFNWMVGRYAMRRARARSDEVVGLAVGTAEGLLELAGIRLPWLSDEEAPPPPASEDPAPAAAEEPEPPETSGVAPHLTSVATEPPVDAPAPDDLAIPGYDSLSAFQVVPRLEDLGGDELEAVRQYEHATRGRRTILSRIAQLQAS